MSLAPKWAKGQWIEARKGSCPAVRTGIAVDYRETSYGGKREGKPGEELPICIAAGCKAHPKAYETAAKSASNGNGNGRYDAAADKAKREAAEAAALHESQVRYGQTILALDRVKKLDPAVLASVLLNILERANLSVGDIQKHLMPDFVEKLRTPDLASVQFARAVAILAVAETIGVDRWRFRSNATEERGQFFAAMKLIGYDARPAWAAKAAKAAAKVAKPAKPEKPATLSPAQKASKTATSKRLKPVAKKKAGKK